MIKSLPLNKLVQSPRNVRRHGDPAADAELKASIAAHGLLQNLIVRPASRGKFEVEAGERRRRAMLALADDKILPKDHEVTCLVLEDSADTAVETSLAENFHRLAMNPADEAQAFAALIDAGTSTDQVARRFGLTVRFVEGRLRLATLAPVVFEALASGEITLDLAKAFGATSDQEIQARVFEQVSSAYYAPSADSIRRMVLFGANGGASTKRWRGLSRRKTKCDAGFGAASRTMGPHHFCRASPEKIVSPIAASRPRSAVPDPARHPPLAAPDATHRTSGGKIMYASSNIAQGTFQADQAAFVAALDKAHARSFHSYFTQFVLTDDEAGYIAVDEGDYPWRLEQSHAMLIGTTGMGKTVAISDMIAEARAKGQRCVVFDLTGAFIEHFYQGDRDIILNPLDARCPQWSLFDECRAEGDFWAAAEALVPHDGGGEGTHDGTGKGSMVFISARYVDMSVCAQLLTLWLDTAMNTLMTTPRTQDLKFWFFLDELGALHRLPALEKGLQTARNFGGAIVTGIHAYAKLKEVYGENMAMTLSSLARTKLILGTADRDTATWCSDFIGHRQVRDMEEGYTYGYNNARDAVSLTPRKHIEPLLLPDQLMNLPKLTGYVKFPDGFPAAPVRLKPVNRVKVAETFIGRAKDRPAIIRQNDKGEESAGAGHPPATPSDHPSSNDDGAGKPVVPKQGRLPLEPEPASDAIEPPQPPAKHARNQGLSSTEKVAGKPRRSAKPAPEQREAGERNARPTPPKGLALRKGAAPEESDPAKDGKDGRRSDAPRAEPPPDKQHTADQTTQRQRDTDARKLMIDDGVPEQEQPSRDEPDLGDFEP